MQSASSRFDCIEGLLQVADARWDVDEYIALAESYKGTPGDYQILYQEGQAVPGVPGALFDAFGKPRIANDGGIVFEDDPRVGG